MRRKKGTNELVLTVPEIVGHVGVIDLCIFSVLAIFFFLTSEEQLHWSFYLLYGAFISIGLYMFALTKKWKVIVKNDRILAYPLIKGAYSFTCGEIVSVQRQVKKNRVKSERIVIKTNSKKKLIVESGHTSYFKFVSYLLDKTESDIRHGFEEL